MFTVLAITGKVGAGWENMIVDLSNFDLHISKLLFFSGHWQYQAIPQEHGPVVEHKI